MDGAASPSGLRRGKQVSGFSLPEPTARVGQALCSFAVNESLKEEYDHALMKPE